MGTPAAAALTAVVFVPEHAGPLLFYAVVGLLSGCAAALSNPGGRLPGLADVLSQSFAGGFSGSMAAVLCMMVLPAQPLAALLSAGAGGFLGPYGAWEMAARLLPQRVPAPPPAPGPGAAPMPLPVPPTIQPKGDGEPHP